VSGVHRELRRADPSNTRVADVANEWGFWHMGQFVADYRRRFGERPSETLRRRSGSWSALNWGSETSCRRADFSDGLRLPAGVHM